MAKTRDGWTEVEWHEFPCGNGLIGCVWTGKTPSGKWDWDNPVLKNAASIPSDDRKGALEAGIAAIRARAAKG